MASSTNWVPAPSPRERTKLVQPDPTRPTSGYATSNLHVIYGCACVVLYLLIALVWPKVHYRKLSGLHVQKFKVTQQYCALQVSCLGKLGNGTCLCHYDNLCDLQYNWIKHLRATAHLPFSLDKWLAKHSIYKALPDKMKHYSAKPWAEEQNYV